MKNPPSDYVRLGKLGKTFQLAGGIRFYALSEAENELIYDLDEVFIEGIGKTKIRQVREIGVNTILYLAAAKSVEDAKELTNKSVFVSKDELTDGSDFVDVIENLPVFLDDKPFGRVKELIKANVDILLIDGPNGEIMIPTNAPYLTISEQDIQLKGLPLGLLELNQ